MAEYKDIHGTNIEIVSSDPSNPVNGQVWYNTTSQTLKGITYNPAGAWASGGALNTARFGVEGLGLQTAALMVGGQTPSAITGIVESYNGSSYSEIADITARRLAGAAGTSTAGLVFGGAPNSTTGSAITETWDGSSWTEVGDMNNARAALGSGGTQTSAIGAGGRPGNVAHSETWNGSAWTETSNLNTARHGLAAAATDNEAALAFGGFTTADYADHTAVTEDWNGSSWTEVADLNTARGFICGAGATNTESIAFGGRTEQPASPPYYGRTETWNGTAWTEVSDMSTARSNFGGTGTQGAALGSGGHPEPQAITEEWTTPVTATVTFTVS